MSPSHTAANPHADPADLHGQDFLVSLLVHALVIGTIIILALWDIHHTPEPLQRIQVSMITPAELDRMIHQAATARVHERESPRPEKIQQKPSPLPALKQQPAKSKPEEPFDPFKPLESKQDVTTSPTPHARNNAMAQMQMQQLSQQEINRYIDMIRQAVEQHWKVPLSLGHVDNPLVELRLNPDGSVASIRILEGSGNAAMDASLSRAIMAAAPFQLPRKQFEAFRDMKLRFIPKVNQQQ